MLYEFHLNKNNSPSVKPPSKTLGPLKLCGISQVTFTIPSFCRRNWPPRSYGGRLHSLDPNPGLTGELTEVRDWTPAPIPHFPSALGEAGMGGAETSPTTVGAGSGARVTCLLGWARAAAPRQRHPVVQCTEVRAAGWFSDSGIHRPQPQRVPSALQLLLRRAVGVRTLHPLARSPRRSPAPLPGEPLPASFPGCAC